MSKQLSLDAFLKKKVKNSYLSNSMNDIKSKVRKKNNLSLIKSPKSPKIKKENEIQVICSDDDDFVSPVSLNVRVPNLDSSQDTIPYTLTPDRGEPSRTPLKTPKSLSSDNSSTSSKFYSPNKKRLVTKRSPVKRKLDLDFVPTISPIKEKYDTKDDKTQALINIIRQCLDTESIKRLLAEECQVLLAKCFSVLSPGLRVVCRMYWRKPGWYKADQVKAVVGEDHQIDDPNFHLMLESLIACGLVIKSSVDENNGNLTFEDLSSILKLDELKKICKNLKLKIRSKQGAIAALKTYCRKASIGNYFTGSSQSNETRVLRIMSQQAGLCYKLSEAARITLDKLYVLMYLGMNYTIIREKRLELTILYDKIKRESYPVDIYMELDDASVVFQNVDEFDRYFTAHCIYEDYLERTDLKEKCDIVTKIYTLYNEISDGQMLSYKALPPWLRRYTPANVYVKILETGIVELKKNKTTEHNTLAVDILTTLINQISFRQHKKADWYAEKSLILYNLQQYDEAAKVLLEGLNSSLPSEWKACLRLRVRKLCSRAGDWLQAQLTPHGEGDDLLEKNLPATHVYKPPMDRTSSRGKQKFETRLPSARLVQDAEQYCISHYVQQGEFTHGGHWEGSIITSIFFLLFWDIIYSKPRGVPGVFLSRYQKYPLDLHCTSFYTNRQTEIEERLAIIELCTTEEMLDIMQDTWNCREEGELSGINRSIGWDSLSAVCRLLPPAAAAALCRRLAGDYRYAHSGFPDLTLWNVYTQKIKFVEVKTDSDKPSIKQIQWMHFLKQNGIDTEFCYVGANTTRCKARAS